MDKPQSIGILSLGSYIPPHVVDNDQVAAWSGADPAWVLERTGIRERRYAAPGTRTSQLAHRAAEQALHGQEAATADLGVLVVATSTPDQPQPSTAVFVQHALGLTTVPAFDVNAVCSGFLYGLAVTESLLGHRMPGRHGLVVGADLYSTLMDRTDRRTVSLFGDGAGAVLLGPVPDGYGLRGIELQAHSEYRDLVEVVAGGTRKPADTAAREAREHLFRMQGRPVRDYALRTLPKLVSLALDQAGLGLHDVGRFILHQANTRLVEACTAELGVDPARVPLVAPVLGNTAAASIPLTLHHEHKRRPFRRGEHLVLAGVGGGMTAGAAVLTWY
ncbi:3-oxoacyl-ACP synthase III family protein [Kitasatospora sp. NPDC089509]|uniref:3-oxoacyl-ACP synthase III family protein n=1 Tax=Kitasatospora sp. NPDC089509 TaxID=3364079 RepID=UPI0037F2141D